MALTPSQLADKIAREVKRAANKGLRAAGTFLVSRIKETLSVPAPRRKLPSGKYVATTRAIPYAPPRKLSGAGRRLVKGELRNNGTEYVVGAPATAEVEGRLYSRHHRVFRAGLVRERYVNRKMEQRFLYMKYHEMPMPGLSGSGKHKFALPTARKYWKQITTIVGDQFKVELGI